MKVLRMIGWLLLMMMLVAGGIYVYNLWLNQTFVTTFYTMETDKPVEGLRLVELSDLHLHEYGEKNADLVQRVQDLAPDLIVVAGDMDIDTNDDYSVVTDLIAQLVAIAPVYYAPGNHEWAGIYAFGSKNLAADMKALGVHWMDQCWEDVDIGESKLRIGGFFEWPRAELERKGSRQVVEAILSMGEYNRFSKGIFGWIGFRKKWLEYENIERAAGETKWSFWKLFLYALEGIVAFSTMPLVLSSVFGILCCALALIMIIVVIVRTLVFGDPTSGWPSLVCIMLLLSGIQMLGIGVVGQYLAKTYLETKHRPIYLTRLTNIEKKAKKEEA